jgi:hypothetical protein
MITKAQAIAAHYPQQLEHVTRKDSRGQPMRCRVNGACQVWLTRPEEFRLPVKYGLRECFYIEPSNAAQWILIRD